MIGTINPLVFGTDPANEHTLQVNDKTCNGLQIKNSGKFELSTLLFDCDMAHEVVTVNGLGYMKFDHVIKRSERAFGYAVLHTSVTLRLTCYYQTVGSTSAEYTLLPKI